MTLNPRNFGLAGGIMFAACMLVMTLLALYTGYGVAMLQVFESIYPGYSISLIGSVVGAAYGFFDCFIGLWIFAWIYNKLEK